MRTAILVGATGLVGGHVLDLLLAEPAYTRVLVLARQARPATRAAEKLDWRTADLADEQALRPLVAGDDLFICLGTTIRKAGSQAAFRKVDLEMPLAVARAAKAAGVATVGVVSSLGADPGSRVFYSRTKGEMEQALRGLELPSLTFVRPSLLTGERAEHRLGERVASVGLALMRPLLWGRLARYRSIPAAVVARALVAAARSATPGVRVVESEEMGKM